jgi:hypothetical protein
VKGLQAVVNKITVRPLIESLIDLGVVAAFGLTGAVLTGRVLIKKFVELIMANYPSLSNRSRLITRSRKPCGLQFHTLITGGPVQGPFHTALIYMRRLIFSA